MEKRIMGIVCLILCLLLMPSSVSAGSTADAKEFISTETECTLNMSYVHDDIAFGEVAVDLYQIARMSSDFEYTLTEELEGCGLELNQVQSAGEWDVIRSTLSMYLQGEQIQPSHTVATDETGLAQFTGLEPGLYFVSAVKSEIDGFCYYFASAFVQVPGLEEDGTWNYEVTAKVKADVDNPTGKDLEYKVLKLWKDEGNKHHRTDSVEVEIYKNGEAVKTVTLSEENHWSYHWFASDDGATWQVVEKNVPEGYVMTVEENVASFVITNTYPDKPETPPSTPQTGDTANMGLYIVLMCVSGMVLLMVGLFGKRKAR